MLYNVADAYYKTGNFDAAAEHYRQVLETEDPELKQKRSTIWATPNSGAAMPGTPSATTRRPCPSIPTTA
jgi:tetratricopeptide (TPR) repeat protein